MNYEMKHQHTPEEEGQVMDVLIDIRIWLNSMDLNSASGINAAKQSKRQIVQLINEWVDEWDMRKSQEAG